MTLWLVGIVDAAIVLTIGLAIVLAARRRSASLLHAVLVAAIVSALLMPVLEVAVPQVPVIPWGPTASWLSASTFTSDAATPVSFDAQPPAPREADVSWMRLVAALWMGGSILLGTALIAGFVRLRRLKARCTPVAGRWRELTDELRPACGVARQVALLQSREPSLLITCGLLRPVIILPSESESWPEARCRAVLRHELAHIRRHDATVQIVGEILRAVHWVNPLAWVACRRLRQESEYACDDAVLMSGLEPAEYATHLIDVARQLSGRRAWLSVPARSIPTTPRRR